MITTFNTLKTRQKLALESIFSDLSLEMVIALAMIAGMIVKLIEKELSLQQTHDSMLTKINVMVIA